MDNVNSVSTVLVQKSQDGTREVTTSLIVAEVFCKNHADVLRDIRNLSCSDEFRKSNFAECLNLIKLEVGESRQKYYEITKDGFMFLALGYTGEKAGRLKEAFINAFNHNEALLKNEDYIISQAHMFLERRVSRMESEIREKDNKIAIQEKTIGNIMPKAEYYDKVLQDKEGITTTIIAKELGMSAEALNNLLKLNKVIYKSQRTYVLYSKYQNRGYTTTKTSYHEDPLTGAIISDITTYWTQAGREFILKGVRKILDKKNLTLKFK